MKTFKFFGRESVEDMLENEENNPNYFLIPAHMGGTTTHTTLTVSPGSGLTTSGTFYTPNYSGYISTDGYGTITTNGYNTISTNGYVNTGTLTTSSSRNFIN
jgi:hypothetical protein